MAFGGTDRTEHNYFVPLIESRCEVSAGRNDDRFNTISHPSLMDDCGRKRVFDAVEIHFGVLKHSSNS
jgi:hypothetical protein